MGNGEQRNCGDPTHNHTIHGGSFWAEAFYSIIAEVRAALATPNAGMFMTEGIAEEVSGTGFDILLGLSWDEFPYWHAVHGGYGYATGRAGSIRAPLSGGGLAGELTKQFMAGGTMGWFTYQNYGDQFFDAANAPYIAYIQALSRARIAAKAWMVHGRATRTLPLSGATGGHLEGACFLREKVDESASVVCAIALPAATPAEASFALDLVPARYGLRLPAGSQLQLTDLQSGVVLGSFAAGANVKYSASVAALRVTLLKLAVAPQTKKL